MIIVATKPDIIKQIPLYKELVKQGESVLLLHTGQHYDFNLSGGMLEEFGVEVDANLQIDGPVHDKFAQIISRLGQIVLDIKQRGKTPVPWVHGDTMTANAASTAGYLHGCAAVHVEAGIRTLTPKKELYQQLSDSLSHWERAGVRASDNKQATITWWRQLHTDPNNFERGSMEPWPEQYNTRSAEPASGIYLASVPLIAEFLKSEGFDERRIFVTGNSVVDATEDALQQAAGSTIFEQYPQLSDGFVRFCIHRQENCSNPERFRAIWDGMVQTIKAGHTVLLISLFATESAIDRCGLRDELEQLIKQYAETFIYSKVWPHYGDVIAAMQRCTLCATDSGSMQEEMNQMQIPTVTLRFGSDRPESFFTGGNVIAPPLSGDFIASIITDMIAHPPQQIEQIYGTDVAAKSVAVVKEVLKKGDPFQTEEERIFS